MQKFTYRQVGTLNEPDDFSDYMQQINVNILFDRDLRHGKNSPLGQPYRLDQDTEIGNRFCVLPLEGSDGTADGRPTEVTFRRWERFGTSGAKLIWGGEAVAVNPSGRTNPRQLMINRETTEDIARLREAVLQRHMESFGHTDDMLVGLQLSHAGRFSRPEAVDHFKPVLIQNHPDLDDLVKVGPDWPILTDDQIQDIEQDFIRAARFAEDAGFDFVDIRHSSGTLGHEFLSAWGRPGPFGGSIENRTRFLREIVEGIHAQTGRLKIGIRLSLFDLPPFTADPDTGVGIPISIKHHHGAMFGGSRDNPVLFDLDEPLRFLEMVEQMGIRMVNLTAGSPYYNTHLSCPAYYPPMGSYKPPQDPLFEVARQIEAVARVKQQIPGLLVVGSGYSYLQEWLPHVAQYNVSRGLTDFVGLGRALLSYPDMPADILSGARLDRQRICRTFSDCITAPECGLVSGCYPLDRYYMRHPDGKLLRNNKREHRRTVRSG